MPQQMQQSDAFRQMMNQFAQSAGDGSYQMTAPFPFLGSMIEAAAPAEGDGEQDKDMSSWADDKYVQRVFRFISAGIFTPSNGWRPIKTEMSEDVLKSALSLFAPKKVKGGKVRPLRAFKDHCLSVDCIIGTIPAVWWEEARDGMPAGITGTIRAERALDGKVAAGMESGTLDSTSSGFLMKWRKSHKDMDDGLFFDLLWRGADGPDGEPVRMIVEKVTAVLEQSIVWDGADPFAKMLANKTFSLPVLPNPAPQDSTNLEAGSTPAEPKEAIMIAKFAKALGLPEIANKDAVLAAISGAVSDKNEFLARAEAAEQKLATIEEAQKAARVQAAVEGAIKEGKIAPASKDHYLALANANIEAVEGLFASMTKGQTVPTEPLPEGKDKLEGGKEKPLSEEEKLVCAQVGLSEENYRKHNS